MSEEELKDAQFMKIENEERPATCPECGAPGVWCTCYQSAPLGKLLDQLEACGFRCEAGPLENHLAFIELRRWEREGDLYSTKPCRPCTKPAEYMIYSPKFPNDPTYSCEEHLGLMVEEGDNVVTTGVLPQGASCCFASRGCSF